MKLGKHWLWVIPLIAVVGLASAVALTLRSQHAWRLEVLASKLRGGFPELTWTETVKVVSPGSGFWVDPFEEYGLYVPFMSQFNSAADAESAEEIFRQRCAVCHGADASGTATGPALADAYLPRAHDDLATYRIITQGIPGTAMPAQLLDWEDRWRLVAYVRSIKGSDSGPISPIADVRIDVSPQELIDATSRPQDWLTYSGTYDGQRFSRLTQISTENANLLQVRWIQHLPGDYSRQQTVPLVRNGIMYLTSPPSNVIAADAATGKVLWRYQHRVPTDIQLCCGVSNRGVALLGNQVVFATLDAHLVALDASTGKVNWEREIANYRESYSSTAAPLAVGDLVITGISGGDYTTRGFIAAYRASDGEEVWRFDTIPDPGSPGHDSWSGDSWKTGGAATWMTGSYDPETGTVFWGVGNPTPEYLGSYRLGDNLYSESVVALSAATGELRWHFQFTPHDTHGWDSCHVPMLVEAPEQSGGAKRLAIPNRNGFFYSLDAQKGTFLAGLPFAEQTWAEGLDDTGRPVVKQGSDPSPAGTLTLPGATGATNWWPSAYSPDQGLLYVPVLERASIFYSGNEVTPVEGRTFGGSAIQHMSGKPYYTAIRALDPYSGELVWERRWADRLSAEAGEIGGLLATAGGLVFGSDQGVFHALDAKTGEVLWSFDVGASINSAAMTYAVGEEQFVAIAAGKVLLTFALPRRR